MILDHDDRHKFRLYCQLQADDCRLIVSQMRKLPGPGIAALVDLNSRRADAFQIVADYLGSIEA